ncbi:unnamed protein product [Cyberlindnera jadinii]|uniref:Uncharacterized protein n=1 Tax=Cyberlindnera jadinii (strain ATCC 18201 / CBS 1600 / BCRC 20928 / JCM 3617 / NBRC 0987 / NRRL Y-1542) TaxID=983966 RepID=A0A0H5C3F1_CYBJN|nr:unnamed protein product [Cyberlindnera jadinii]
MQVFVYCHYTRENNSVSLLLVILTITSPRSSDDGDGSFQASIQDVRRVVLEQEELERLSRVSTSTAFTRELTSSSEVDVDLDSDSSGNAQTARANYNNSSSSSVNSNRNPRNRVNWAEDMMSDYSDRGSSDTSSSTSR